MTKKETAPMILPVLSLRGLVLFPKMMLHFDVGRKKSILALNAAMQNNQSIYLAPQLDIKDEDPGVDNLAPMGVVGTIKQNFKAARRRHPHFGGGQLPGEKLRMCFRTILT